MPDKYAALHHIHRGEGGRPRPAGRTPHCHVVLELKTRKARPEHFGQLGFHVSVVDDSRTARRPPRTPAG